MKECNQCKEKKNGLKTYVFASRKGVISKVAVCPVCSQNMLTQGFLYRMKKDDQNIGPYIRRAQEDMKKSQQMPVRSLSRKDRRKQQSLVRKQVSAAKRLQNNT